MFIRECVFIERVIGQWKKHFQILSHPTRLKLDRVPSVVISTAILRNVAKVLQDGMDNLQPLEDKDCMAIIPPYIDDHPQQVRVAGQASRRLMANNMRSLRKTKGLYCNSNN